MDKLWGGPTRLDCPSTFKRSLSDDSQRSPPQRRQVPRPFVKRFVHEGIRRRNTRTIDRASSPSNRGLKNRHWKAKRSTRLPRNGGAHHLSRFSVCPYSSSFGFAGGSSRCGRSRFWV